MDAVPVILLVVYLWAPHGSPGLSPYLVVLPRALRTTGTCHPGYTHRHLAPPGTPSTSVLAASPLGTGHLDQNGERRWFYQAHWDSPAWAIKWCFTAARDICPVCRDARESAVLVKDWISKSREQGLARTWGKDLLSPGPGVKRQE